MRPFRVIVIPREIPLAARVERSLRAAARTLGLSRRLREVRVRIRASVRGDDATVRWHLVGARVAVRIDVDSGNFLTPQSRRVARAFELRRWSERGARATFLHELAHVADALRFGIDATRVSARRRASFHEAWNVWIDGRLARRGGEALPRPARLREFRKSLGRRARHPGVRPAFERLWGARRMGQRDLLDVVEGLVR